MTEARKGVLAVVLACLIWGGGPAYYRHLSQVAAPEMLAHRTLWTLLIFGGVLLAQRRLGAVAGLLQGAQRGRVLLATLLISANWFIFIWAVQSGHAVEASLGYYIFPLVAVLIGFAAFGERLALPQVLSVALASLGVGLLTYGLGVAPLIALSLAATFASYSALKRGVSAPPIVSVTAEVAVMAPVALCYLAYAELGLAGPSAGWFGRDLSLSLWLPWTGLITGVPLMLFSYAARRVSMATLGLVQFLNPTLQFLTAVLVFLEPISRWHLLAFGLIWLALAIYSAASWRQDKALRRASVSAGTSATAVK
ncbi:MAG: protein RarD [Pseudorhodobacter sp. PARRP1]|nr:MAG: protein RarD [Pseudorhodobacter sp. PARRP1]